MNRKCLWSFIKFIPTTIFINPYDWRCEHCGVSFEDW